MALIGVGAFGIVGLLHPGFFSYGMRHLTTVLAEDLSVTGFVLPEPVTPTITSSELTCNPLNLTMAFELRWSVDSGGGTFTYDIERNGLPLVSGLPNTATSYLDTSLTIATTYTYVLRANGPMGPGYADSLPITLTTPYNCDGLTPPIVEVTMFNGRPLASYRDETLYDTTRRRPMLTGTSNIPYARIRIVIDSETRLVAEVGANLNGFWEWTPVPRLNFERSTMNITATDPLNANRYAVTSLPYQILRGTEETSSHNKKDANKNSAQPEIRNQSGESKENIDFSFILDQGKSDFVQGDRIGTTLLPKSLPRSIEEKAITVRYRLLDEEGNGIMTQSKDIILRSEQEIAQSMEIPLYVRPGRYSISVDMTIEGVTYSKSQNVVVRSLPVIKLSSGRDITYDEFIWNIGLISFVILATLLLWLFFVFYEYWLFMKGKLYVDELDFRKFGFISRL